MSTHLMEADSLVAMDVDLDSQAVEVEVEPERKIWVQKDEEYQYWPFARWANVDVLNSPTLTRLFKNLTLETSGLPDDIEELVLPDAAIEPATLTGRDFITGSELVSLCYKERSSSKTWDDYDTAVFSVAATYATQDLQVNTHSSQQPTLTPFKFPNSDTWLPSGIQIEIHTSPFNELYPFSAPVPPVSKRFQSPWTVQQAMKTAEREYTTKLKQLRRAGFEESRPVIVKVMTRLADIYYQQGRERLAETLYRKVISVRKEPDGSVPVNILQAQCDLISSICEQGRVLEASRMLESVFAAITKRCLPDHFLYRDYLKASYIVFYYLSNFEEAEAVCRDLVQICLVHLGPRSPDTLDAMRKLAQALRQRNQYAESERLERIAVQLCSETHEEKHNEICWSLLGLGWAFESQCQFEAALKLFRLSAERAREFLGDEHLTTMKCNHNLGGSLRRVGLPQESESLLAATARAQMKVLGEDHLDTLRTIRELGRTLRERGKYDESLIWLEKSFRKCLILLEFDYSLTMEFCSEVGLCYEDQGRYTDALALYQETMGRLQAANGDHSLEISGLQRWVDWVHEMIDEEREEDSEEEDGEEENGEEEGSEKEDSEEADFLLE